MRPGDSIQPPLGDVFIAHRAQLRVIAQKIVGSKEHAEDVTQDAYLRIAEGVRAKHVNNPIGYCCQVVRNIAIDHYRRQSVETAYRVYTKDGELPEVAVHATPDRVVDERNMLLAVERALGTLPPRTRLAFELFRLGGLTQREIGRRLDCSATLVNFMVKDAMNALAACRRLMHD
jgi:RNA polymerase sigma factor (sigma-70 family)